MDKQKGTYILLLLVPDNVALTIGKLGRFQFPAGFYAYVGSAFGSGGLIGRVRHHLAPISRPHWHIDYLRQVAEVVEIWFAATAESREYEWVDLLLDIPGSVMSVDGFGASDSAQDSHLVYFDVRPEVEDFEVGAHHWFPDEIIMKVIPAEAKNRDNGKSS